MFLYTIQHCHNHTNYVSIFYRPSGTVKFFNITPSIYKHITDIWRYQLFHLCVWLTETMLSRYLLLYLITNLLRKCSTFSHSEIVLLHVI